MVIPSIWTKFKTRSAGPYRWKFPSPEHSRVKYTHNNKHWGCQLGVIRGSVTRNETLQRPLSFDHYQNAYGNDSLTVLRLVDRRATMSWNWIWITFDLGLNGKGASSSAEFWRTSSREIQSFIELRQNIKITAFNEIEIDSQSRHPICVELLPRQKISPTCTNTRGIIPERLW